MPENLNIEDDSALKLVPQLDVLRSGTALALPETCIFEIKGEDIGLREELGFALKLMVKIEGSPKIIRTFHVKKQRSNMKHWLLVFVVFFGQFFSERERS